MCGTVYVLFLFLATSFAEWTPNPLCPYPSYEPTYFPDSSDCTKYYVCMDGTRTALSCPLGYAFSDELKRCEPVAYVNCDLNDILRTL